MVYNSLRNFNFIRRMERPGLKPVLEKEVCDATTGRPSLEIPTIVWEDVWPKAVLTTQ